MNHYSLYLAFFMCLIASKGKAQEGLLPDTITFELTSYNNVKMKVLLNEKDTLDLKFDSGATGLLLTHDAIAKKTHLLSSGKEETPTRNYVALKQLASLQIGAGTWDSMEVYPVRHSGHGTDGRFGWDLFEGKVVEIDYEKKYFIIHPRLPELSEKYAQLSMIHSHTLFCIEGRIDAGDQEYSGQFLFDTGYQRALLLDSVWRKEQNFPDDLPLIKVNRLKNGAGDVFITKVVTLPGLELGGVEVPTIPTQLLNAPNPAGFKTHILGNELLKRFNTVLDFQDNVVYLKPNALMSDPYTDES